VKALSKLDKLDLIKKVREQKQKDNAPKEDDDD